ncbi:MAG TPA: zf-HC2 domain-containing protein [Acidimicrobiales bacterium]|nr:zf-HC2 domain-containing protein [Acidimicrobiales bacterium]
MTGPVDDHLGELLSALVDSELTPEEQVRVEEHLAGCPTCRTERDQLAQVRGVVRDLPALDLPPPLWVQLMRTGRRKSRPAAWVSGAAATAAAVALFGLAATPTQHHHVTPQMAHLVQVHAASSGNEPVTGLAPAAVNANFAP